MSILKAVRKNLYFLIIFVCSFLIIFYDFPNIPQHLAFDEVEFTRIALHLENKPYIPYVPLATGHSTLYFYILLLSFKLFGVSTFGLRFPSAIFGIGTVLVFYVLLKKIFKSNIYAFIGAFILLSTRWFFSFAKFSFEATFLLFLELLAIYFLLRNNHQRKKVDSFLSGIFSGLSFHSYIPGRIFFLVPMYYLHKKIVPFMIFLLVFLFVSSPLINYLSFNPDSRVQETGIIFNNTIKVSQKVNNIFANIQKNTGMFLISGDMNGRHNFPGKPAVNPIMLSFITFGLFLTLKNFRKKESKLFLLYALVSFAPTLLTTPSDNPNMLRTFTIIPSLVYFSTFGIQQILCSIKKKYYKITLFIIGCLMVLSAAYDARTYFVYQTRVQRNAFEIICPLKDAVSYNAQTLGDLPEKCRVQKNEF